MTRGRARTHLDATCPGDVVRRALCSWLAVDTTTDVVAVTCKKCLELFRSGQTVASGSRQATAKAAGHAEIAGELASAFQATLAPTAGPPPRLTPAIWNASCKGGEWPCRSCELCDWHAEAERWASVAPWNKQLRMSRPEGAPRWSSLAAALCALAEYERHGRAQSSASGGILQRIELGPIDGIARADDPLMRRGGELVVIRVELERAYPVDAHRLAQPQRSGLLLARTPGVLLEMPTYEALAEQLGESVGELKALVKAGRRSMTWALSERGLIPAPREYRRREAKSSMMETVI